jgi:hypothetical protein
VKTMVMLISVLAFSLALLLSFSMAYRYRKERRGVSWLFSGIGGFTLLLSGSVFAFIYTHPKPEPSSFLPVKVSQTNQADPLPVTPATSYSAFPENQTVQSPPVSRSQERNTTAAKTSVKIEKGNNSTPPTAKQQKRTQSGEANKGTAKPQPDRSEPEQATTPKTAAQEQVTTPKTAAQEQAQVPSEQSQRQPEQDNTKQPVEQNAASPQPQPSDPAPIDTSSQPTEQQEQNQIAPKP